MPVKIFSIDGRSQKFYSGAKAVILLITSCRKGSRIIRHFCSHFPDYDEEGGEGVILISKW